MSISTVAHYQRLIQGSSNLRSRQLELEEQISTGYKSRLFSGLGNDAIRSVDLRGKLETIQSYKTNIETVKTRTDLMDTAMQRISEISSNLQTELLKLSDDRIQDAAVVRDVARQALDEVGQLMNTQVDGRYLFGGSSVETPPFNSANTLAADSETFFETNFSTPMTAQELLDGIRQQLFIADDAYTPPNGGNMGGVFNSALAEGDYKVGARIDDRTDISYGLKADAAPFRELLAGIAAMAALEVPTDPEEKTKFLEIVDGARAAIGRGATGVSREQGILGTVERRLDAVYDKHKSTEVVLKGSLGEAEEADVAEAVTRLKLLETQLQATYSIIGNQSRFSLVDYLT